VGYIKEVQSLVGRAALGKLAGPWRHPKTGPRINLGTQSGYQGQISVLQQDTIQGCNWPPYWTRHPEETPSPTGAAGQYSM